MPAASHRGVPLNATAIELAQQLRDILRERSQRLVLAESCTAGRVAATLAILPGMSQWLCGSFVVYRTATKTAWLDVPTRLLDDPSRGPVSADASRHLARAALTRTAEADWAIAVTGDVGPAAPAATDGVIFLAAAARQPLPSADSQCQEQRVHLVSPAPGNSEALAARLQRLEEATEQVLRFALAQLQLP